MIATKVHFTEEQYAMYERVAEALDRFKGSPYGVQLPKGAERAFGPRSWWRRLADFLRRTTHQLGGVE